MRRTTARRLRGWLKPTREADLAIGGRENPYLLRWYLIPRNRWLNIYYHEFRRDDDDRALHDHPWASVSIALAGAAHEHDADGVRFIRVGDVRYRAPTYAHRMVLPFGPCETLFVTGPVVRAWGFWCPRGRWVPWQEFTAGAKGELVGKGCGED